MSGAKELVTEQSINQPQHRKLNNPTQNTKITHQEQCFGSDPDLC